MKQDYTDITFVLDRSGSMSYVADDTIGGFNRVLEDQKKTPGTATVTLNQFDDTFECVIDAKDIQSVEPLTDKTFVPRGSTALLDAIGKSVEATGKRLDAMPEDQRPAKVIVVILTDGHENASRTWTTARVNELISRQRDTYNWEFVFLGADQDAIATASSYGINPQNAIHYANTPIGTKGVFDSVSTNMMSFRSMNKKDMSFEPVDYKTQADAGVTP